MTWGRLLPAGWKGIFQARRRRFAYLRMSGGQRRGLVRRRRFSLLLRDAIDLDVILATTREDRHDQNKRPSRKSPKVKPANPRIHNGLVPFLLTKRKRCPVDGKPSAKKDKPPESAGDTPARWWSGGVIDKSCQSPTREAHVQRNQFWLNLRCYQSCEV